MNHKVCFSVCRQTHRTVRYLEFKSTNLCWSFWCIHSSFPLLSSYLFLWEFLLSFNLSYSLRKKIDIIYFSYLSSISSILLSLYYSIHFNFHLSIHTSFSCLPANPPSIFVSLFPPSLPFIASSSLHLSIDNLPLLCPLQPSKSDPVRGLMLWKMTVNRHFCCHHHRFGASCRLQPCCLATPQTASLQKARAPVCSAEIETRA